jgi:MFS family permease
VSAVAQTVPGLEAQPVSRVMWLSFASASLAWLFDALDLTIFILVLVPSVTELIASTDPATAVYAGSMVLACKLLAWGLGGIAFGIVADRIGRAKTMLITVLVYALFTGLSGLAQNVRQLTMFQALAGVGIGGEWAAGAALVAETWPEQSRQRAIVAMSAEWGLK